jgi:hypothetical protein
MLGSFPADPSPASHTMICKTWPSQLDTDTRLLSPVWTKRRGSCNHLCHFYFPVSRAPGPWTQDSGDERCEG